MGKPKLSEYFMPILKSFNKKSELTLAEIKDSITANYDLLQIDTPRRSALLINNCIGYFIKAKVLIKLEEKLYQITDRGIELLNKDVEIINIDELRKFEEFNDFISKKHLKNSNSVSTSNIKINDEEIPEDKISFEYELFKTNLSAELLECVKKSSWQFFEILVLDLLVAMGYGDPYNESRIKSGSSDGGIDGIIKADVLGLEIICIQAKKWEGNVGRPEIQKFAGSLESHKAKKGVFITTSTFSSEAKEYIKSIEKKIILIDGERLAELMIDYNIGVGSYKKIELKKIDTDYFDGI